MADNKPKDTVTLDEVKGLYESSEKIAFEIRMLSRAVKKISSGSLRQNAVVLLLHESSGVGKPDIRKVLEALDSLERNYLKPQTTK